MTNIKEIEYKKTMAEDIIIKVISKLEEETGCICEDISLFSDLDEKIQVNIDLCIKHRLDLKNR